MDGSPVDTPERARKGLPERRSEMHLPQTGQEIATVADIKTPDPVMTGLHVKATIISGPRLAGPKHMAVRRMDQLSTNPGSISLAAIGWPRTLPGILQEIMTAGRAPATTIRLEHIGRRVQIFSAAISASSSPIASRAVASSLPENRLSTNHPSASHLSNHRTLAAFTYSAADTRRRSPVVARVPGTGIPAGAAIPAVNITTKLDEWRGFSRIIIDK